MSGELARDACPAFCHTMPPPPANPADSTAEHRGESALTGAVGHYENFPVASWLCPPALRPAVVAIYHFARTADDLADEGDHPPEWRLEQLAAMRAGLHAAAQGIVTPDAWPAVFAPLASAIERHHLPVNLLDDLLKAFEQDVRHTASNHRYATLSELLDYCRWSANPVGRLLLHLYGIQEEAALRQSDAVCSALQLINFWQDISRDHARGRYYLPQDVLARHALDLSAFQPNAEHPLIDPSCAQVVSALCAHARALMLSGAPLVRLVPGRAGWELRLVIQGGLRILDHCAAIGHQTWRTRPRLHSLDLPLLLWRAWRMPVQR